MYKVISFLIIVVGLFSCGEVKKDSVKEKSKIVQWGNVEFDDLGNSSFINQKDGNSYIVGTTEGDFENLKRLGGKDIFVSKFDSNNNKIWSKLLGGAGNDYGNKVIVSETGNIYILGSTKSSIGKEQNSGDSDIFLYKLDSSGKVLWVKLFGSKLADEGLDLAIKNDVIYLTGYVSGKIKLLDTAIGKKDIFVASVTTTGELNWFNYYGTPSDESGKAIIVNDNIYITGENNLLTKIKMNGDLDFIKEGSGEKLFKDNNEFYLLNGNIITKLDKNGVEISSNELYIEDAIIKNLLIKDDSLYLLGETEISFDKIKTPELKDIFVVKMSKDFDKYWTKQWGTMGNDYAIDLSIYEDSIYILGTTQGSFNENDKNRSNNDLFLLKFDKSDIENLYKPCDNITCSSNGTCEVVIDKFKCNCNEMYFSYEDDKCILPGIYTLTKHKNDNHCNGNFEDTGDFNFFKISNPQKDVIKFSECKTLDDCIKDDLKSRTLTGYTSASSLFPPDCLLSKVEYKINYEGKDISIERRDSSSPLLKTVPEGECKKDLLEDKKYSKQIKCDMVEIIEGSTK